MNNETTKNYPIYKINANKIMYLLGMHFGLGKWEIKYDGFNYCIIGCVDNNNEIFLQEDTLEFSFNSDDEGVFVFDSAKDCFDFITELN